LFFLEKRLECASGTVDSGIDSARLIRG